jgi:hypothetical protein
LRGFAFEVFAEHGGGLGDDAAAGFEADRLERADFDGEREFDLVAAGGVAVTGGRCGSRSAAAMGPRLEELQQPIFAQGVIRLGRLPIARLTMPLANCQACCCSAPQTTEGRPDPSYLPFFFRPEPTAICSSVSSR